MVWPSLVVPCPMTVPVSPSIYVKYAIPFNPLLHSILACPNPTAFLVFQVPLQANPAFVVPASVPVFQPIAFPVKYVLLVPMQATSGLHEEALPIVVLHAMSTMG